MLQKQKAKFLKKVDNVIQILGDNTMKSWSQKYSKYFQYKHFYIQSDHPLKRAWTVFHNSRLQALSTTSSWLFYYDLVQHLGFLMHKNHRCSKISIHDLFSF